MMPTHWEQKWFLEEKVKEEVTSWYRDHRTLILGKNKSVLEKPLKRRQIDLVSEEKHIYPSYYL